MILKSASNGNLEEEEDKWRQHFNFPLENLLFHRGYFLCSFPPSFFPSFPPSPPLFLSLIYVTEFVVTQKLSSVWKGTLGKHT